MTITNPLSNTAVEISSTSMRWLMRQPAYAEHLIYAPQCCFTSDTPQKWLYMEMQTVDWWWVTMVKGDTPG